MKKIYLDNAATTPVMPEVFEAMKPYFCGYYGNPSGVYEYARIAKRAVDASRGKCADLLGARPKEIFFTSGGSEADNWALFGTAGNFPKGHIITTKIEHSAVLMSAARLEELGVKVTYISPDSTGMVSPKDIENAITDDTFLISCMFANNEVGTIEPIYEIGQIAKKHNILFHTDAVQAVGHIEIDVDRLNIDLLSMSGHKLGAPKGVGALFVREGVKINPLIYGGGQERHLRAGTENVAGIVGFGKACEIALRDLKNEGKRLTELRERLINGIFENIPYTFLNGHREMRLPGNVNIGFRFLEAQDILLYLDMQGISASAGSACHTGSADPSHVLMSLGRSYDEAHSSVRFTLGRDTSAEDIDTVIKALIPLVKRLRDISPQYLEFKEKNNVQ